MDGRPAVGVDPIGSGQDHGVGSAEGCERFPEESAGKDPVAAEGIRGVDRHDVEVPPQPPMLEAVVEDDHIGPELPGPPGRRRSIPIGDVGHAGQHDRQLRSLVADPGPAGRVPSADHRRLQALPGEMPRDPGHQRGFAGASERQIADRHDRQVSRPTGKEPEVVEQVPRGDGRRVRCGDRGQATPQHRGADAPEGSVDQPPEGFRVR